MSKQKEQLDPYERARLESVIKRAVFDPSAPSVSTIEVIRVAVQRGDGSREHPAGHSYFYYLTDGTQIGEEK